jgi:hypothetical protein
MIWVGKGRTVEGGNPAAMSRPPRQVAEATKSSASAFQGRTNELLLLLPVAVGVA